MGGIVGFVIVFILVCFVAAVIYKTFYRGRYESAFGKFVWGFFVKTVLIAAFLGMVTCSAILDEPKSSQTTEKISSH